jgi:hypothetical protein
MLKLSHPCRIASLVLFALCLSTTADAQGPSSSAESLQTRRGHSDHETAIDGSSEPFVFRGRTTLNPKSGDKVPQPKALIGKPIGDIQADGNKD